MKLQIDLIIYSNSSSDFQELKVRFEEIINEADFNTDTGKYFLSINLLGITQKLEADFSISKLVDSKIYIGYWFENDFGGFEIPQNVVEISNRYKIPILINTYIEY